MRLGFDWRSGFWRERRFFKRWRLEIKSRKFLEKLLLLMRKRDLRLRRPVRFGIWSEREFPLRLRTLKREREN